MSKDKGSSQPAKAASNPATDLAASKAAAAMAEKYRMCTKTKMGESDVTKECKAILEKQRAEKAAVKTEKGLE